MGVIIMTVLGLEKWGNSLIEEKLDNGNIIYYVEKNGMYFEVGIFLVRENKLEVYKNVNDSLMTILLNSYANHFRVRIWYGDTETGRSWDEEYGVTGTIGRTNGNIKIPIMVNNSRSLGGRLVLVDSIIRIDDIKDKRTLYKADNFHVEKMEVKTEVGLEYPYRVMQYKDSGEVHNIANFKDNKRALHWIDFMNGDRYCK